MNNVVIGIQARTTSTRLPKKIFEKIEGKEILQHVIDTCDQACHYLNKYSARNKIAIRSALLIPHGDNEIIKKYRAQMSIIEGDEHDVLNRFELLHKEMNADYYVRITSDCPLLPPYLIAKHVNVAVGGDYDYVSNVDMETRSSPDGHDVEVFSKNALRYLLSSPLTDHDKEHVTLYLRRTNPGSLRFAHVTGHLDLSHMKLSVDTQEDLERVRAAFRSIGSKISNGVRKNGSKSIHRY